EREPLSIRHGVGVRVKMNAIRVGEPNRMRVTRIQGGVFQQTQAPILRRVWPLKTMQPVVPVLGMTAQVFPGQCRAIQMQNVEIRSNRMPVLEAQIDHKANPLSSSGATS